MALEKTILALGGSGRVGRMLRAGFEIAGEHRVIWQSRTPLPGGICLDPLADDGVDALADAMKGRDVVFALAGVTPATGGSMNINSALANQTLAAAEQAGIRHVFFVSSAAVYGVSDVTHREEEALTPVSDYGVSKQRMEEDILRAQSPVRSVILRIGNIVGADQLIGGATKGTTIGLDQFADGGFPERSYMGPITLTSILTQLFDRALAGDALPQILNVSAPGTVSMDALVQAGGFSIQPRPAPEQAIPLVVLDTKRIEGLVTMPENAAHPDQMIAEWKRLQAAAEGSVT
ncbi:NAD(P)-dependent oxidoreductase [Thalassobius sp. I31.1]|uniref:NAD-dependent epimerase/dehydratase family protein n=1 Tax=Thalassobius sp. I31.1 TaxID=2109912 RepID=UPI001300B10F|nr:NAD(P)-dependent oxidoreductase [Thalassobius sp. I31.1]